MVTSLHPVILIPARMASTRLPGKPLADIKGVPMIVHVVRRSEAAKIGDVYVACAEQEIKNVVEEHGGKAVLTDPSAPSGSDRIWAALNSIDPEKKYDTVVNVQGDLPSLDPALIESALLPLENPDVDIVTLACRIGDPEEADNPNVVKVAAAWNRPQRQGRALYFSRSRIPAGEGDCYHHIGLYAYRRAALERFTSLPPSPLEQSEKLEQLRALEDGMRIEVVAVDTVPLGVDTPAELARAREIL